MIGIEFNTVEQVREQLQKAVTQAIHDIQSPLMCLLALCANVANPKSALNPSDLRARILGILKSVQQSVNRTADATDSNDVILVAGIINKILAEKECEYANLPIIFQSNIYECKNDASIVGNIDDFTRMLSNLINNAVESVANNTGVIRINCDCDDGKLVQVTIEDSGQGMQEEIKNKILNNERVTDKSSGQGLGFTHTRETLAKLYGNLNIESKPGIGTKVILTLPYANELDSRLRENDENMNSNRPNMCVRENDKEAAGYHKDMLENNKENCYHRAGDDLHCKANHIDIVIVEDDKDNAHALITFMFKDKKIDVFNTAQEFLANYNKYPQNTIMLIDYQFPEEDITGIDIYKELYAKGFTRCYLYSGMEFKACELPSYIKVILKTDINAINDLAN